MFLIKTTEMAALTTLPAELLHEILLHLPPSSLVSVCRTSKALQLFFEPFLYKSIKWGFDGSERHGHPPHPIHSFFWSLCQRPALASYVKKAELRSDVTRWTDGLPNLPAPSHIQALWLDALKLQSLSQWDMATYSTEISRGSPGAFIGLLLASLHNIEVLVTDYTMLSESDMPHVVFRQALGTRSSDVQSGSYQGSRFLKLKEAIVRNNLDSRIIKDDMNSQLSSIFSLRSLEHVTTILQCSDGMPWETARVASQENENLPTLRTLRLTNHLSNPGAITALLANAPRLERLEYFLVEDTDDLAQDEEYEAAHTDEWPAFSGALLAVAESLKSLKISIDEAATSDYPPDTMDIDWMEGISARRGSIGSLRGLRNLTKLEIPMYLLLGRYPHIVKLGDVLPPSLRKLCLRDDHVYGVDLDNCDPERVIELIRNYLVGRQHEDNAAERVSLEELGINLRGRGLYRRFDLEALEKMSQEAGIKCIMHLRKETFMSTKGRCIDQVEELTIYDPSTVRLDRDADDTVVGETGYPTRYFNKEAGCFESNV